MSNGFDTSNGRGQKEFNGACFEANKGSDVNEHSLIRFRFGLMNSFALSMSRLKLLKYLCGIIIAILWMREFSSVRPRMWLAIKATF